MTRVHGFHIDTKGQLQSELATLRDRIDGEQPPLPGARKAPDGHWYLPDPMRPGKYLRLVKLPPTKDNL
jgi:hypothetical protein